MSGLAVLKMKNWGRILLVMISSAELVVSLILPYAWVTMMANEYHRARFIPTPIPIIYGMNLWFFNKKRIREQFVKESG